MENSKKEICKNCAYSTEKSGNFVCVLGQEVLVEEFGKCTEYFNLLELEGILDE